VLASKIQRLTSGSLNSLGLLKMEAEAVCIYGYHVRCRFESGDGS